MNPITQRSTTPAGQNGALTTSKPGPQKAPFHAELSTADKHAHDRLLYLMANFLVCSLFPSLAERSTDSFNFIRACLLQLQ